jgi:hypothetical protein
MGQIFHNVLGFYLKSNQAILCPPCSSISDKSQLNEAGLLKDNRLANIEYGDCFCHYQRSSGKSGSFAGYPPEFHGRQNLRISSTTTVGSFLISLTLTISRNASARAPGPPRPPDMQVLWVAGAHVLLFAGIFGNAFDEKVNFDEALD